MSLTVKLPNPLPSPRLSLFRTWAPAPIVYIDTDARIIVQTSHEADRMVDVWIGDRDDVAVASLHISPAALATLLTELQAAVGVTA